MSKTRLYELYLKFEIKLLCLWRFFGRKIRAMPLSPYHLTLINLLAPTEALAEAVTEGELMQDERAFVVTVEVTIVLATTTLPPIAAPSCCCKDGGTDDDDNCWKIPSPPDELKDVGTCAAPGIPS